MLFCPECAHRIRFDGDWAVVRTARAVHYVCPDCRTEIAARPTHLARSRWLRFPAAAFREAWEVGFGAWRRVWFPAALPPRTDG